MAFPVPVDFVTTWGYFGSQSLQTVVDCDRPSDQHHNWAFFYVPGAATTQIGTSSYRKTIYLYMGGTLYYQGVFGGQSSLSAGQLVCIWAGGPKIAHASVIALGGGGGTFTPFYPNNEFAFSVDVPQHITITTGIYNPSGAASRCVLRWW